MLNPGLNVWFGILKLDNVAIELVFLLTTKVYFLLVSNELTTISIKFFPVVSVTSLLVVSTLFILTVAFGFFGSAFTVNLSIVAFTVIA